MSAQQDVGEGCSGLNAELGKNEDVADVLYGGEVHGTADVENEHEFAVFPVTRQDVPDLRIRQKDIAFFRFPVVSFSGVPGEHIDGNVGVAGEHDVVFRFRHDGSHPFENSQGVVGTGGCADLPEEILFGFLQDLVVGIQPGIGGDGESGIPEPLLNRDKVSGIDLSGSGASLDRVPGAAPVEGDRTG